MECIFVMFVRLYNLYAQQLTSKRIEIFCTGVWPVKIKSLNSRGKNMLMESNLIGWLKKHYPGFILNHCGIYPINGKSFIHLYQNKAKYTNH